MITQEKEKKSFSHPIEKERKQAQVPTAKEEKDEARFSTRTERSPRFLTKKSTLGHRRKGETSLSPTVRRRKKRERFVNLCLAERGVRKATS